MSKKLMSVLMSLFVVASMMPMTVFAADDVIQEAPEASEIVVEPQEEPVEETKQRVQIEAQELEEQMSDSEPLLNSENEYKCGDKAYYKYDKSSNTMTISGEGSIYNGEWSVEGGEFEAPFEPLDEEGEEMSPENLIVEEGITIIGSNSFADFGELKYISLPSTLTQIGDFAFADSNSLREVQIAGNAPMLGKGVFHNDYVVIMYTPTASGYTSGEWKNYHTVNEHTHSWVNTCKPMELLNDPIKYRSKYYGMEFEEGYFEDGESAEEFDLQYYRTGCVGKLCETCGEFHKDAETIEGEIFPPEEDYTYKGSPVKAEPEVDLYIYNIDYTELEEGVDYLFSYRNNNAPGTGTVIITGKGDYVTGQTALDFEIKGPHLQEEELTLIMGKTYSNKLVGARSKVTWSSSSKKIASVSKKGKITAKKPGTCTIKAKSARVTYTCTVNVLPPEISDSELYFLLGDDGPATLSVNGGTKTIKWSSSDNSVATVNSKGVVTPVSGGTCTIKAVRNGYSCRCQVTVKDIAHLNINELELYPGEVRPLKVTGGLGRISWKSEDESVAVVDYNGKVEAIGTGSTTIIMTRGEDIDKCKIIVEKTPDDILIPKNGVVSWTEDEGRKLSNKFVYIKYYASVNGYVRAKVGNVYQLDSCYLTDGIIIDRSRGINEPATRWIYEENGKFWFDDYYSRWMYPVTAGQTYYLQLMTGSYANSVTFSEYEWTRQSGGWYKSTATNMKKNTMYYGTGIECYAYDNRWYKYDEEKWYKIKLSKAGKLAIYVESQGWCYVDVYQGSKLINEGGEGQTDLWNESITFKSSKKLKAGTYYVMIAGEDSAYKLKWYTI